MNNFSLEYILQKEWYLHFLFWIAYIAYPLVELMGDKFIYEQWVTWHSNFPLVVLVTYASYIYFFPAWSKVKLAKYVVFILIMTVAGVFFSKRIIDLVIYQLDNYSIMTHVLGIAGEYGFISLIFFGFYSVKNNYRLEKARRQAEIQSLKNQISPHFLLNTLNSIYAYSLEGDQKASELILKLSENFKYVLKQGQHDKVTVDSDLQHIMDFIKICELRWGSKLIFRISTELDNPEAMISPLLIVSFIENAAKYASKLKGKSHEIRILYKVKDGILFFECTNPYNPDYKLTEEWEQTGIGLSNVRNRLNLGYTDRYMLAINEDNALFNVKLKLTL